MTEIFSYLYIGDAHTASKTQELNKLGITHVLNVADNIPDQHKDKYVYLHIEAIDEDNYDISQHFEQTNNFIEQGIKDGGKVYVHCAYGVSRAPTIVIAYLIGKLKYSFTKAKHYVEKRRQEAYMNLGFIKQLENYAEQIQKQNQIPTNNTQQQQKQQQQQNQEQQKQQQQQNTNENINKIEQSLNNLGIQQSNLQTIYRCKSCRYQLCNETQITHQKKDPFKDKCSSIFIEQPEWIKDEQLYENSFKLNCPKCKSKLGDVTLSGKSCSCGQWVAPAIQIQLKQIDVVKSQQQQSMQIKK